MRRWRPTSRGSEAVVDRDQSAPLSCHDAAIEELIRQIRAASSQGLYYVALLGALTLPDICGALASENGRASGSKFKSWLRSNVPGQAESAEMIYGLRCSMMHQGQAMPEGSHFPIAFMAPGVGQLHNLSTVVDEGQIGWLSIEAIVEEVTAGAEEWLEKFGTSQIVTRNLQKFARLRPEGLPPHVRGPVIA